MKKLISITFGLLFLSIFTFGQVQYTATGGGNAFALNHPSVITTLTTGLSYTFKANHTITGAATLNINGLGAVALKKDVSINLASGDIVNGQVVTVVYDGTNFQIMSPLSGAGGGDNLGDHTATTNLQLAGNYISNDGGNEGITVNNVGHVGVNNPSPTYMFEIGINPTSQILFRANGTGYFRTNVGFNAPAALTLVNANSSSTGVSLDLTSTSGASTATRGRVSGLSSGTNEGSLAFTTKTGVGWTEKMRINHLGDVGIGISTPSTRFHVMKDFGLISSNAPMAIFEAFNSAGNSSSAIQMISSAGDDFSFGVTTLGNYAINANNDIGGGSDLFTITPSASVGINTTSPSSRLHIMEDVYANTRDEGTMLDLEYSGADSKQYIRFSQDGSATRYYVGVDYDNVQAEIWAEDNMPILIGTNNTERMRIDGNNGNIGIGNTNPNERLTVTGNAISLSETAAFVGQTAGFGKFYVSSTDNHAHFKASDGVDYDLTGGGSGAFSTTGTVTSNAPGNYTTDDFVFGSPQIDDDGDPNHDIRMFFDKSTGAFRAGRETSTFWNTTQNGQYSVAMGYIARASGDYAVALGSSIAHGDNSASLVRGNTMPSAFESFSIGYGSYSRSSRAISMGYFADITGDNSVGIGSNVETTTSKAFVLGTGVGSGNELINSTFNSLMIGFNSNIPTVFVGPSAGVGTTGNVGIGTATPSSKLEVNGDIAQSREQHKFVRDEIGTNDLVPFCYGNIFVNPGVSATKIIGTGSTPNWAVDYLGQGHYQIVYSGTRTFSGQEVMVQVSANFVQGQPCMINYNVSGLKVIDVYIHDFNGNPHDEDWSFVLMGAQ